MKQVGSPYEVLIASEETFDPSQARQQRWQWALSRHFHHRRGLSFFNGTAKQRLNTQRMEPALAV
ncbi:MAG: hypothetical protein R2865_01075 [Deinococcales bacterium]